MELGLTDRIAVVTGGSKGIGASIVRVLAREGVIVNVFARASLEAKALCAEVRASGGRCEATAVDVLDANAIKVAVDSVADRHGGIDVLVNNVGGAVKFGGFEELTDEDWMRAYEFNVLSTVRLTRAALQYLRRSTLRRIVNISSISAVQPGHFNPHYSATKAAVVNLSKHLANILAKERILVNAICAGPIHSESWDQNVRRMAEETGTPLAEMHATVERNEAAKVPLGQVGEGEFVAAAVAFLASHHSSWTTGTCVHVSGGKLSASF